MTSTINIHGLGLTDVLIIAGILAYLLDRLADARGWSRTSKTLRRENEDLIRRNGELEQTVGRHEDTIRDQGGEIAVLQAKVRELEQRDQAAVLDALRAHEASAERRHTENATRHQEALSVWMAIRDNLQEGRAA